MVPKLLLTLTGILLPGMLLLLDRRCLVDGLNCYECTSYESREFCNSTASIKSCSDQEVCISKFVQREDVLTSFRGCLNYTECQKLEQDNDPRCIQGPMEPNCTMCCSTDFCNSDRYPEIQDTGRGHTEGDLGTNDEDSRTTAASQPPVKVCPTSDEVAEVCLVQFRDGVQSVIRGNESSFSNFCRRNIPDVLRCYVDATQSCQSGTAKKSLTSNALQLLWEKLRHICPMNCNRSAALSCVLEVFDDIMSAFANRSNSFCDELLMRVKEGYQCIAHSVSSCEDGGAAMETNDQVLRDLESVATKSCPRLPAAEVLDYPQQQVYRVGLAPCRLEEALHGISQAGSEIIRNRIEEKSLDGICNNSAIESNMTLARLQSNSCFLVRRKRALLASQVIDRLRDRVCADRPTPSKCNTTAARICIIDLIRLVNSPDVQDACNCIDKTKSCVETMTEECRKEERESLKQTFTHVVENFVAGHCTSHFKCLSKETIFLTEGGGIEAIEVQVMSSPELICNIPGCKILLDIIPENRHPPYCRSKVPFPQFLLSSGNDTRAIVNLCTHLVTNDNWKEIQVFQLTAKVDFKYDNTQLRKVRIVMRKVVSGVLRERKTVCEHKVIVLDGDRQRVCKSVTDPHISTFDGRAFNVFLEGFFTLYRHKTFPYEVQAAFQRCVGGGATCNCAVAVRAGDTVFLVDKCRKRASQVSGSGRSCGQNSSRVECLDFAKAEILYHDKITPGFHVFTRDDAAFEVLLPHGTRIFIRGRKWYNVYIHPSPYDWNKTEGLCGTYDGQTRNDLTLRNGRLFRESLSHRGEPPLDFSLDWRVQNDQLLVDGVAKGSFRLPIHCDCGVADTDGEPQSLCSSSRLLEMCDFDIAGEITFKLPKRERRTNEESSNHKTYKPDRKRRESGNQQHGDVYNFDLSPDVDVVQFGNWTKSLALDYCNRRLINDSTAVRECLHSFEDLKIDFSLESCVEDLLLSGDTSFVDGALEVVKSECMELLAGNVSLYNTEDGNDISLEIEESLCMEECGEHGLCLRGRCYCVEGYVGSDCQTMTTARPGQIVLANGLCDRRWNNCSWAVVLGEIFLNGKNLVCHLQEVQLLENGTTALNRSMTVKAFYISSQQVLCPTDISASSFLISISNDGVNFSDQHLFLSRDIVCYDCTLNTSGQAACRRKAETCLVSGTCYFSGEESRQDPCLFCNPEISTTELDRRTNPRCTKRTLLTVGIVVLAVILCLLTAALAYRQTSSRKSSATHHQPRDATRAAETSKIQEKQPDYGASQQGKDNIALESIEE